MAQKTEYQDLEVKGSVIANKVINPEEPANHLLRADGNVISPYNPVNFPKGVNLQSSTEALTNAATVIELHNFELSQIPTLLNKSLFISNNENVVQHSDRLYELIDNETGDITVVSGITNPVLGQTLRYTAINPNGALNDLYLHLVKNNDTVYAAYCVYIPQNLRCNKAVYKVEYYIYTNETGDGDYNNKSNYVWKTVFEKELNQWSEIIYPLLGTAYYIGSKTYTYIYNVRVSIKPTTKVDPDKIQIKDIDVLYYGLNHLSPAYANRLINFDAVIEPTQTSSEFKSPTWLWQYLVQGVNWLRKNYLPASTLDTKTISDFSDLSASQVNYLVDSTLTDSIFSQKVTFPSDWKGRKISLTLAPIIFQKDYDYSLKVMFANYMKATGARLFLENDLSAMVGVSTLIKIIIDNNVIIIEAYIEA